MNTRDVRDGGEEPGRVVSMTDARLAQLAAPEMEKAGGGAMLAITSMSAENKNKRMAAYASSKAAASHLVRNIAFDLGPKGIRVNGIAPGAFA